MKVYLWFIYLLNKNALNASKFVIFRGCMNWKSIDMSATLTDGMTPRIPSFQSKSADVLKLQKSLNQKLSWILLTRSFWQWCVRASIFRQLPLHALRLRCKNIPTLLLPKNHCGLSAFMKKKSLTAVKINAATKKGEVQEMSYEEGKVLIIITQLVSTECTKVLSISSKSLRIRAYYFAVSE